MHGYESPYSFEWWCIVIIMMMISVAIPILLPRVCHINL